MTKTIKLTLTDTTSGTWSADDGSTVATGARISEDRDYWQLVDVLQPHVAKAVAAEGITDALITCVDPNGTDLGGDLMPDGEEVCSFRVLNGEIAAMV